MHGARGSREADKDLETRIPLLSLEEERQLFGPHDRHVRKVAKRFRVRFSSRGGTLRLQGPDQNVATLAGRIERLLQRMRGGDELSPAEMEDGLMGRDDAAGDEVEPAAPRGGPRAHPAAPQPRTEAQRRYAELLEECELVFAIGPAGTGKTFLAVAAAVEALRSGRVRRLVLTRPAVEAGEHLGFLPGDMEEKVNPYLRPLYDALNDLLSPSAARRMKDLDMIEVAPVAFMRGRTLNHSFVILDEAQNATAAQLKMILTRLGEGTRAVVTGDLSQSDLPDGNHGLHEALEALGGIEGVGVVEFGPGDVQRSALVQRIVEAYGDG